jgi:ribulose-5-phosphate 4-epimerase/fuculose-1-phosphate aldolase
MRCGLLPISQPALAVRSTVAYHPYGGVGEDSDEEGAQVVADLRGNYAMIRQNHGLLVCGRTPGEAFLHHYFLQSACEIQVDVMRAGGDYVTPSEEAINGLAAWSAPREKPWGGKQWDALVRFLDRTDPSYAQ